MGKSQQVKGKEGEREVANILKSFGLMARRGQVWNGEPDIIAPTLPIHLEVKRQETVKIGEWMRQSQEQSRGLVPAVVFRRSREKWKICMELEDFLRLWTENIGNG